ncbi:MAG: hypothetical protein HY663_02735 [Chloroflexi bacterium]|nr:hypothetical protein [Chloroflexota bacterium]
MVRTFDITPATTAPLIFIGAISLLLVLLIGFFVFAGYSSRNTKFEVSDQGLRINGSVYGRFIPREAIAIENIKTINLATYPEYQPKLRTNGVVLPGYSTGWFRLKNNEKALLFVTDRSKMVYIPTRQGYAVLLSVSQADEFYQATKQWQ